jgi:hypothetical protein
MPRDFLTKPNESEWPEYIKVEDDPLTFEQQINIINFAYKFRYAILKYNRNVDEQWHRGLCNGWLDVSDLLTRKGEYRKIDQKQLDEIVMAADKLPYAPIKFNEESFQILIDVLNNPALKFAEFGIDPQSPQQTYACSILLEAVFKHSLLDIDDPYCGSMAYYCTVLCDDLHHNITGRTGISLKQKLLMNMDPIQKTSSGSPTSLDFLLAHTHFSTGVWSKETCYAADGTLISTTTKTQDREEYRRLIRNELSRLYHEPSTHVVMAAFGELMQEQELFLLINRSFLASGFNDLHPSKTHALSRAGFYDGSNAICVAGFINPAANNKVEPTNLGTIVHESLHLIFDKLVKQQSSPVNAGEGSLLDEAIAQDQRHRIEKYPTPESRQHLNNGQMSVWNTVVDALEHEKSYFGRSLKANQHTMRVEIIVRPMEQIASGVSVEDVKAIMPNVWQYYQDHCEPILIEYLQQRRIHQEEVLPSTEPTTQINTLIHKEEPKLLEGLLQSLNNSKQNIPEEVHENLDNLISKIGAYQVETNRQPSSLKTACAPYIQALEEIGTIEDRTMCNAIIQVVRAYFCIFDYLYSQLTSRPCFFQYQTSIYTALAQECNKAMEHLAGLTETSNKLDFN